MAGGPVAATQAQGGVVEDHLQGPHPVLHVALGVFALRDVVVVPAVLGDRGRVVDKLAQKHHAHQKLAVFGGAQVFIKQHGLAAHRFRKHQAGRFDEVALDQAGENI